MKLERSTRNFPQNIKQSKFDKYFTASRFDLLQKEILPRKLLVPVTNICNANCVFCGYQYITDPKRSMDLALFEEVIDQYVQMHPSSYVSLTPVAGDPLVDPGFFQKVSRAKGLGVKTLQCYTNAILLEENVENILNSPLDHLEVSLADFNRAEYKKIFRVDKYEQVLRGLHKLLKTHALGDSYLSIDINLRPARAVEEIYEEEDFKRFVRPFLSDKVTISAIESFDNWTGMISKEELPTGMQLKAEPKTIEHPCTRLFDLQVLPNADVRLCGCRSGKTLTDDLIIGNLHSASLRDIWFSETAYQLRKKFFHGEVPNTCIGCSFYERIGRKRFFMSNPEFGE